MRSSCSRTSSASSRRRRSGPFEAARAATAEIALPVLATTLSLAVIFIPVSFMSSISGRFLYQFGITAAVAIMVSLLVSFTLTPMMSARLLRADDSAGTAAASEAPRSRSGFYARIDRVYSSLLGWSMAHRLLIAGLAVVVTFSSDPALLARAPGVRAERRGRRRVRGQRAGAGGVEPGGDERRHEGRREGGPLDPRRDDGADLGRRRFPWRRQPGRALRAPDAARGAGVRLGPIVPGPGAARSAGRLPRTTSRRAR